MVDKINTVRRTKLGQCIGELKDADVLRLNRAVVTFLGIASTSQAQLISRAVRQSDERQTSDGGRYWDRTSDRSGVNRVLSR